LMLHDGKAQRRRRRRREEEKKRTEGSKRGTQTQKTDKRAREPFITTKKKQDVAKVT